MLKLWPSKRDSASKWIEQARHELADAMDATVPLTRPSTCLTPCFWRGPAGFRWMRGGPDRWVTWGVGAIGTVLSLGGGPKENRPTYRPRKVSSNYALVQLLRVIMSLARPTIMNMTNGPSVDRIAGDMFMVIMTSVGWNNMVQGSGGLPWRLLASAK